MTKITDAKGTIGSSFDDFLHEEGIFDEVQAGALKKVMAHQLQTEMKAQKVTKVEMARRMKTSRSQLDRLLDPTNEAVSLEMLSRAASAIGRGIRLELI